MEQYVNLAYQIAKLAHQGQVDQAGVDYIHHPEVVASLVHRDVEKAVAYLHDVLEDTAMTADELRKAGIPDEVVSAVITLTKRPAQDYFAYLAKVKDNQIARVVKIADLTHNSDLSRLSVISEKDLKRLAKYQQALAFLN